MTVTVLPAFSLLEIYQTHMQDLLIVISCFLLICYFISPLKFYFIILCFWCVLVTLDHSSFVLPLLLPPLSGYVLFFFAYCDLIFFFPF